MLLRRNLLFLIASIFLSCMPIEAQEYGPPGTSFYEPYEQVSQSMSNLSQQELEEIMSIVNCRDTKLLKDLIKIFSTTDNQQKIALTDLRDWTFIEVVVCGGIMFFLALIVSCCLHDEPLDYENEKHSQLRR